MIHGLWGGAGLVVRVVVEEILLASNLKHSHMRMRDIEVGIHHGIMIRGFGGLLSLGRDPAEIKAQIPDGVVTT